MDHKESIQQAIARELHEEVHMTGDFSHRIIAAEEPSFLQHARVWQMRLVFEVRPVNMSFKPGDDGDEVAFIDPERLRDSNNRTERRVYEYALLASS